MVSKLFTIYFINLISIATMLNAVAANENSNQAREGVANSPSVNGVRPHASPITWDPNHQKRESKDVKNEILMAKRNHPHASTGTWSPHNPQEGHFTENEG